MVRAAGSAVASPCVEVEDGDFSQAVPGLPERDRFVFVNGVLERYSIRDCALLPGRSPRDIDEARHRVCDPARQIDEHGEI